jgi:hypothetical protein
MKAAAFSGGLLAKSSALVRVFGMDSKLCGVQLVLLLSFEHPREAACCLVKSFAYAVRLLYRDFFFCESTLPVGPSPPSLTYAAGCVFLKSCNEYGRKLLDMIALGFLVCCFKAIC